MALVIAYEDARTNRRTLDNPATKGAKVWLLGFRYNPALPDASLDQRDAGGHFSGVHFHNRDKFQVAVDAKFRIGRHEFAPYSVHFFDVLYFPEVKQHDVDAKAPAPAGFKK